MQSITPNIPVTNRDGRTNYLDITQMWCYDTENEKKGVNFMLNMVIFINAYCRGLAPYGFVG